MCSDLQRGRDLDHCSLSVPAGARVLLVSDPDSTASTLLRALAGLARLDGGRMRIAGSADPSSRGWGRRVAYLGPNPGIHAWMTPTEALYLAAELLELPASEREPRIERALAWAGIPTESRGRPMTRGGVPLQQRTGLAAATLGDPEVLLFDEPLRAIEATERSKLLRLPGPRRTILIASRYPASEQGLASYVVFLRSGRVELIAPLTELEAAGLPLSHRGIEALAAMRAEAGAPSRPMPRPA
jgi:ABC-type multidrug transport system ATPase subunit